MLITAAAVKFGFRNTISLFPGVGIIFLHQLLVPLALQNLFPVSLCFVLSLGAVRVRRMRRRCQVAMKRRRPLRIAYPLLRELLTRLLLQHAFVVITFRFWFRFWPPRTWYCSSSISFYGLRVLNPFALVFFI
eukprot:RCo050834